MTPKGNQKHLTFEQRVEIEKGLTENKSFYEIGRIIGKDPSIISKKVKLHARTKERQDPGYTNHLVLTERNVKLFAYAMSNVALFVKSAINRICA